MCSYTVDVVVLSKRWIVERSFASLEKCRRSWKICEHKLETSLQFAALAFLAVLSPRHGSGSENVTMDKRYFVSSLRSRSQQLANAIRRHWEAENRLHWCLDVTFHEDACRMRRDHVSRTLNIVRKIAMNLLRMYPLKKTLPK